MEEVLGSIIFNQHPSHGDQTLFVKMFDPGSTARLAPVNIASSPTYKLYQLLAYEKNMFLTGAPHSLQLEIYTWLDLEGSGQARLNLSLNFVGLCWLSVHKNDEK